ncbi:MAG TPA: tripartite tricarboxylate transporter TctB family protein [Thermodesulfobacteriota bacterium]|nr:tripartite tricarboxylate transporter TctB family protein [Thermodesulfobacteriota bacterium]
MRDRLQILPPLFWIGLSITVMALSWRLGLKDQAGQEGIFGPGPGLMPFLVSGILLLVSLGLLARGLLKREAEAAKPAAQVNYGKIILVLVALFAYAFLLDRLGYVIVTFLLLALLFWKMGTRWHYALIASAGTALLTYFLFTYLGLLFPEGIFKLGVGR